MALHHPLPRRVSTSIALTAGTALLVAGCAGAPEPDAAAEAGESDHFPVDVTACGHTSTLTGAPEKAVTLNQGATEVALALGVADQLAGTAYLDDAVPEKWLADYESVEVLADEYPTREVLLDVAPDFVYGSYASAFGDDVAGSQAELDGAGVASYLSPFGCTEAGDAAEASFESAWAEIDAVADAFGVPERADEIRAQQEDELAALADEATGEGTRVFWFDSGDDTAFAGAGGGGPQLVLDAIGAENVFADVEGGWADVAWERVVAEDPDVIVLADAAWSTADEKIAFLESDPVLSRLRAVQAGAFVTVPFSESTPGVRLVDGAASVADQLGDLALAD